MNGVLFKFAVDSEGLYANDDTSAAKVAGQVCLLFLPSCLFFLSKYVSLSQFLTYFFRN